MQTERMNLGNPFENDMNKSIDLCSDIFSERNQRIIDHAQNQIAQQQPQIAQAMAQVQQVQPQITEAMKAINDNPYFNALKQSHSIACGND